MAYMHGQVQGIVENFDIRVDSRRTAATELASVSERPKLTSVRNPEPFQDNVNQAGDASNYNAG